MIVVVDAVRARLRNEAGHGAAIADPPTTVHGKGLVVGPAPVAVDEEHADCRPSRDLLIEPDHCKVVFGRNACDCLRAHREQSEVGAVANFPGQSQTAVDRDLFASGSNPDASGEEQLNLTRRSDGKLSRILQEERALFRKEQAEAVQIHLQVVDFDLREVGVVRRVERQAWRERVLQVETELFVGLTARERAAP